MFLAQLNRQKLIVSLFSKDFFNKKGDKRKYKTYDFQKFKTIKSFGRKVYNDKIRLEIALK